MSQVRRGWIAFGLIVAVLLVAAAAAVVLPGGDRHRTRFDAAQWRHVRATTGDRDELRTLADAAVDTNALIGRSSAELRRMLGEPDRELLSLPPFWEWDLGRVSGLLEPRDTDTLRVHFDRAGRSDGATHGQ